MDAATIIFEARRQAGMSQRQLGARAATSAAAISLYESGQRVPQLDTLVRIVAATGSTVKVGLFEPAAIDVDSNGRDLVQLLELVGHLPRKSAETIEAPVFADLASASKPQSSE